MNLKKNLDCQMKDFHVFFELVHRLDIIWIFYHLPNPWPIENACFQISRRYQDKHRP